MLEILKNIPFFSSLHDGDLEAISTKVKMEYFPAEHVIFNEGDEGDKMYIIKSGEVQVIRGGEIITNLKEHAFFGEMALVSDEKRNATIKIVSDVELLIIEKIDFKQLLETHSAIAEMVSYEVVKRANATF